MKKFIQIQVLKDSDSAGQNYTGNFNLKELVMYCTTEYENIIATYATFRDSRYYVLNLTIEQFEKILHDNQFNVKFNETIGDTNNEAQ